MLVVWVIQMGEERERERGGRGDVLLTAKVVEKMGEGGGVSRWCFYCTYTTAGLLRIPGYHFHISALFMGWYFCIYISEVLLNSIDTIHYYIPALLL